MSVSVKRVEHDFAETGQTPSVRTDVSYELGADIDGTWVPFVTVAEGRVQMFAAAAEAAKERAKQEKAAGSKSGTNG